MARGGQGEESGNPIQKNPSSSDRLKLLTHGSMPSEIDFLMSVSDRFDSPFKYTMGLHPKDSNTVERAADIGRVDLVDRGGLTAVVSPTDFYRLIDALRFMGTDLNDERAFCIASAMLGHAGFEWI